MSMGPDLTPNEIRNAVFRTTLRGLDRLEVEALLDAVAARIEALDAEREKLKARVAESPSPDLESEFEEVGREVASILQVAREAADSMRERANLDAARWRREATEEAELTRREAAVDAEAMRRDAWVTGTELLEHAQETAEAMRASAERDVLTVMGEAEREAHRLTSGSRREAEDLVRNANMEAEQIIADASTRRDEIIDGANRQTAAAQERARALENRRDELLEELENVRSTLTRLEGSLEERREALDLTREPDPSVRVVHPPSDAKKDWQVGETVRVVRPEDRANSEEEGEPESLPDPEPAPDIGIADEVSDQVARIQKSETRAKPDLEGDAEPEPVAESEPDVEGDAAPEPVEEPEPVETAVPARGNDELDALFASLRGGGDAVAPGGAQSGVETGGEPPEEPSAHVESGDGDDDDGGTDWLAVRESRLLPITNRALRGVKKAMTDVQNVALDSLRTDEGWQPDREMISQAVHAELVAVWSESFAVGHDVAEEMEGEKLKRPIAPESTADEDFAADLAEAVADALQRAGEGPRERQSAASRVFRVWRSDEAERRIRDIALRAYETGIESSRSISTG
jgi:DivIVA domain-containing protein